MPKRSSSDPNLLAARIVADATAEKKNPAAVALGRLGGKKGGPARKAALSKKRLSEIGKLGAAKRWGKRKPKSR
jgi:hypothetical protein